eukprot:gene14748-17426_t
MEKLVRTSEIVKDSTEDDETNEERLPGEGRPLAVVTIEDVILEFVLERTK